MHGTTHDTPDQTAVPQGRGNEPQVTIEMGGPNIIIRSMADIDFAYTAALADAVNVANDTGMVVVIDPETIRCDDALASSALPLSETRCAEHVHCRSVAVEAVEHGVIRVAAEYTSWMIDIGRGTYCQIDTPIDIMFLHPDTWTPVIAIYVTPTKLSALTLDGTLVTSRRAHRAAESPAA
jgi:hypothetical protein